LFRAESPEHQWTIRPGFDKKAPARLRSLKRLCEQSYGLGRQSKWARFYLCTASIKILMEAHLRMTLEASLKSFFSSRSIQRGSSYFLSGAVTKIQFGELEAKATVRGTDAYLVALDWSQAEERAEIRAFCSCPYAKEGSFCKHLWAFALALDRTKLGIKNPASRRVSLVFGELGRAGLVGPAARPQRERPIAPPISSPPVLAVVTRQFAVVPKPKASGAHGWRSVFQAPTTKAKKKTFDRGEAKVFAVLSGNKLFDPDRVQFRFYVGEPIATATGESVQITPLALPRDREIALQSPEMESVVALISALARSDDPYHGSYGYGRYQDANLRELSAKSLRAALDGVLASGMIFASTDDFREACQAQASTHLMPARFGALRFKVQEGEADFILEGAIQLTPLRASSASRQSAPSTDLQAIPLALAPATVTPPVTPPVAPSATQVFDVEEFIPVRELEKLAEPSLFRAGRWVGYVDSSDADQAWFSELSGNGIIVPKEDTELFLEEILNQPIPCELPPSLSWEVARVAPAATLHLSVDKAIESAQGRHSIDLRLQYGPRSVSRTAPGGFLASADERKVYARDRAEEDCVFALLPQHLILKQRADSADLPSLNSANLFAFVKAALEARIPVVVENQRVQEGGDFQFNVSSGLDWFEVGGQADFSGRWVKMPAILEAVRRGERFVPLAGGAIGLVSDEMKKRLERLATFAESTKDGLRFGSAQGLILNSLLEGEKNVKADASFTRLKKKIQGFSGVQALDPVASFRGALRQYQKDGLGWLEFLDTFGLGGVLADEMGLGKTIQCLAFLEGRRARQKARNAQPSLLLAPKSLLQNWRSEAEKFTPGLRVLVHAGLDRKAELAVFKNYDLVVATYHTMLRDLDELKDVKWDCVILDEAQAIKNPNALIAKASKLLPSRFRLAMTGTPIENSIQDLYSISDFVNPGFLAGKKRSARLELGDEARESLARAFKPVILRRTKEQVLKDLPEKTEQVVMVDLEAKQLKSYNELKRFYQSQLMKDVKEKGVKKSRIQVLAALTRLRQAALHTGLIDPAQAATKSAKFEIVLEMLSEVVSEGHRVLVFSQFTSLLALLQKELKRKRIKFCYLDGKTTDRKAVVDKFRSSSCPVFLMSLKAGGVGLNLVEADYVFLLDPWWNPAVESQAIDRVHRIGQKRAVNAYRFIAKGTVEEKILELQKAKKEASDGILGSNLNLIKRLTAQDIENIFS
jgi:superfamily II DNA or RNA helicase